jgi:biopolymer transport protein ExbB/TolQ
MSGVSDILRSVVSACEKPVIVLLLAACVVVVVCLGSVIAEYFTEHRQFKVFLPKLVDDLENAGTDSEQVVRESGLLLRQKQYLIELMHHENITDEARESLAVGIEHEERRRYENRVKFTDLLSRIAPMLGLLGTLIPLGPGIMALGEANTQVLSESLLTAFDTTSLGLMIAAVALVVSHIRKRWYKDYLVSFDAVMECVVEECATGARARAGAGKGAGESYDA